MVLKFPSGRVSVSHEELQNRQHDQLSCGICNKPWVIKSDECIMHELHVLHPCQHLIGSGCGRTMPENQKDKCPVCKIVIQCNEIVRVHRAVARYAPAHGAVTRSAPAHGPVARYASVYEPIARYAPASPDSYTGSSTSVETIIGDKVQQGSTKNGMKERTETNEAQAIIVKSKMKEGLNNYDIRTIMCYKTLHAHPETFTGKLSTLLAATKPLTPTHGERLVLFLTNIPQNSQYSNQQRIRIALSAFNICRGTNFTMNNLQTSLSSLSSAEYWIKYHFAAVLDDDQKAKRTLWQ